VGGVTPERLSAERNLLTGHRSRGADGTVNVVVEIPAGTNAKWEAAKDGGGLVWEREHGRPRVVQYLPYPANYGMIPATRLAKEHGGDGDPLDVVLLGPARPRGAVVPGRLIGVLRLLDRGEQDDKLLAVDPSGPFAGVHDLTELERDFPGATQILDTWFAHYKGPGKIETAGFGDRANAVEILEQAEQTFRALALEKP
jgi:inorganic pyrophosphatase